MKKILIAIIMIIALSGCQKKTESEKVPPVDELTKVRIGWQVPWATQGQLVQVMKHTDILKNNKLSGDFKGFTYGGPLNEAALAGEVDVVLTADQPALTLLSKNPNWVVIGRLMYNRVSLYVPVNSDIKTVAELKGKNVGMPFGAAAQRLAWAEEKKAGLDPKSDVQNSNLGIYEQSQLVQDVSAKKWGNFDALAGFDPTPAVFEEKGLVKNLSEGKIVSLVLMSKDFITAHPEAPAQFMKSLDQSYVYFRDNVDQADAWFKSEAGLEVSSAALKKSASIEPNLQGGEIRLDFTPEDYLIIDEAAAFLYEQKIIQKIINIQDFVSIPVR